jgi:uncharacterized heparinase superfamily protein
MTKGWLGKISRATRMPPGVLVRRIVNEAHTELDRYLAPARARRFGRAALLRAGAAIDLDQLWQRLASRPYPAHLASVTPVAYDSLCPGDRNRIISAAEQALTRRVNLLGTGIVALGCPIDWHQDYKTGVRWPYAYAPRMRYVNPNDASDVKVPWEISRLQWLLPCGQAYLLTGDERYARGVRDILEEWIAANPFAYSVNWACTMEVALRILSWTWLFHVFARSASWADAGFRTRFLTTLFLHGEYTEHHLELSSVNGNHFTADVAALVFAGLFFGTGKAPRRWQAKGWNYLLAELPRQVTPDGADFEGSIAYHRLVLELFLLPALYRRAQGLDVPDSYRDRLIAMARFSQAYSRSDGSVPLVGDADDARALPLGGQHINDHRYLAALVGCVWDDAALRSGFCGSKAEVYWLLGPDACRLLPETTAAVGVGAKAFPDGGYYVLRNERDHVFIDCGPIGTAGRGGQGHNDCLSFEAVLDGTRLISDCGAYLYTASFAERNSFRSTSYHNTPRVDGEEINRFVAFDQLWVLHNDARPELRCWQPGTAFDLFQGTHTGYRRLPKPVQPVRRIVLDHARHALFVEDIFEGGGEHHFEVPLHLAPLVQARIIEPGRVELCAGESTFTLGCASADAWSIDIEAARVSPSYGVVVPTQRLVWRRVGGCDIGLTVYLVPGRSLLADDWLTHIRSLDAARPVERSSS